MDFICASLDHNDIEGRLAEGICVQVAYYTVQKRYENHS